MRSASVLVPRSASQQSKGPGTAPDEFWINPIRSAMSSRVVTSMPPTMSEWPFKYLVVECLARRVARAGVLTPLVAPERLLDVGRGLIDGAHHRPAEGIADVSGVHGTCRKAAREVLIGDACHGRNVRAASLWGKRPLVWRPCHRSPECGAWSSMTNRACVACSSACSKVKASAARKRD